MDFRTILEPFVGPIGEAARWYPLVAAVIVVPFAALHYGKWGRIHPWRAVGVYSFAFYLLAAFFLVLLPLPNLPARGTDLAAWNAHYGALRTPELDPTACIRAILTAAPGAARSRALFQVIFNILLLLPFGFYLVWIGKRRASAALALGFALSLFFELTQLTGIFGIYPGPYRLFDTGDLALNASGSLLGAVLALVLGGFKLLPDLDTLPPPKAPWIGPFRRFLAFFVDFAVFLVASIMVSVAFDLGGIHSVEAKRIIPVVAACILFILLPTANRGRTVGKQFMRCAVTGPNGGRAPAAPLFVRQLLLWGAPAALYLADYWLPGGALSPGIAIWLFAAWCLAWAVNAVSAMVNPERAGFLDRALRLRVRNSWRAAKPAVGNRA